MPFELSQPDEVSERQVLSSIIKYYRVITESFAKVYGSERFFQLRGSNLVPHYSLVPKIPNRLTLRVSEIFSGVLQNGITFRALVNGSVDRVELIFSLGLRRGS